MSATKSHTPLDTYRRLLGIRELLPHLHRAVTFAQPVNNIHCINKAVIADRRSYSQLPMVFRGIDQRLEISQVSLLKDISLRHRR